MLVIETNGKIYYEYKYSYQYYMWLFLDTIEYLFMECLYSICDIDIK